MLGYCPVGNCDFHHMMGSKYPKCFVIKLCEDIASGLEKILKKGELTVGTGIKLLREALVPQNSWIRGKVGNRNQEPAQSKIAAE